MSLATAGQGGLVDLQETPPPARAAPSPVESPLASSMPAAATERSPAGIPTLNHADTRRMIEQSSKESLEESLCQQTQRDEAGSAKGKGYGHRPPGPAADEPPPAQVTPVRPSIASPPPPSVARPPALEGEGYEEDAHFEEPGKKRSQASFEAKPDGYWRH